MVPIFLFVSGYTPGTPYKVSCSPTSGAVPPYSSSPNPYQTAVYPVRSAYPQQNPYAQVNVSHVCIISVTSEMVLDFGALSVHSIQPAFCAGSVCFVFLGFHVFS